MSYGKIFRIKILVKVQMAEATLEFEVIEQNDGLPFLDFGNGMPLEQENNIHTKVLGAQEQPVNMNNDIKRILLDVRKKHGRDFNSFSWEVIYRFQKIRASHPDIAKKLNINPPEVDRWISYINFQYQILNC